MARPTDYNQEIVDKAKDYRDNHEQYGDSVPSVAGLALHIGKPRQTIYDWKGQEGKEEFSDIINGILAKQERILVEKGLTEKFNPTITKLLLSKHGYTDKRETDITSGGQQIAAFNYVLPEEAEEEE